MNHDQVIDLEFQSQLFLKFHICNIIYQNSSSFHGVQLGRHPSQTQIQDHMITWTLEKVFESNRSQFQSSPQRPAFFHSLLCLCCFLRRGEPRQPTGPQKWWEKKWNRVSTTAKPGLHQPTPANLCEQAYLRLPELPTVSQTINKSLDMWANISEIKGMLSWAQHR